MKGHQSGFTLLELLVVVAVFMVLAMSVPLLGSQIQKHRFFSAKSQLTNLIVSARTIAFSRRVSVVICPSGLSGQCGEDWTLGVMAYGDKNSNGVFDGGDEVIASVAYDDAFSDALWSSFAGAQRMYFHPSQGMNASNGTMLLCSKDKKFGVKLVLNRAGRLKERADAQGDCLLL